MTRASTKRCASRVLSTLPNGRVAVEKVIREKPEANWRECWLAYIEEIDDGETVIDARRLAVDMQVPLRVAKRRLARLSVDALFRS